MPGGRHGQLLVEADSISGSTRNHPATGQRDARIPAPAPSEKPPAEVLDDGLLMSRVDNDVQLLQDLVDLYLGDYPRLLDEIRAALGRKDSPGPCKEALIA